MRDYRFDVARVVCMTIIVAYVHLYAYIHPGVISAYFIPACATITDACLGLFTFVSGFLLGRKYVFGFGETAIWSFYQKRLLRIIPLFIFAAVCLWLIGFNSKEGTINGVICISPFVKVRPMTLWYIPVILYCYLITPLVSRTSLTWKVCVSVCIMAALLVLEKKVASVDKRLAFNVFFYLTGIITSTCFDWKMKFRNGEYVKIAWVLVFIAVLIIGHQHGNFHNLWFKRLASGIGVFALLFVCEWVSDLLFGKSQSEGSAKRSSFVSVSASVIKYVSYASMAVYMFHRLFFWLGEKIYNPSTHGVKWGYMVIVVFPVMCVLSYYIQKIYDLLVNCITAKKQ